MPCVMSRLSRIFYFTLFITLSSEVLGAGWVFTRGSTLPVAISQSLFCYHPTPTPWFFLFLETCSRNILLFLNSLLKAHE